MKRILIVVPWYLPGYKGGGPIRTIANAVEWLGDDFQLFILTYDRDLGDCRPYASVKPGVWQPVGKAQVLYLAPGDTSLLALRQLFKGLNYDFIYLNSFFSPLTIKILLLRKLGLITDRQVVLATRGELSRGALALKYVKKRLYIFLIKRLGLYTNITWQASSEYEKEEILSILGEDSISGKPPVPIKVAPNLPPKRRDMAVAKNRPKHAGSARIIFLSRIARKKNLDVALGFLKKINGEVQFDIYGPIEDKPYWKECVELIHELPTSIQVRYMGEADPEQVVNIFSHYHLFLFPTRGENFGHVILEALKGGCLIMTSDQTPWRNLAEKMAGWDIPLSAPGQFYASLADLLSMDDCIFEQWSKSAQVCANKFSQDPHLVAASRGLFSTVDV
jgi:glycosyltransferase involved in cell wall biosynthesis